MSSITDNNDGSVPAITTTNTTTGNNKQTSVQNGNDNDHDIDHVLVEESLDSIDVSNDDNDDNDMESLLPQSNKTDTNAGNQHYTEEENNKILTSSTLSPLEIHMNDNSNNNNNIVDNDDTMPASFVHCLRRSNIHPYRVGNMIIIFPEYFHSSGFGVLGPHWFGPACVWLILVGATHLCIKAIYHRSLGIGSIIVCYLFLSLSTYRLLNASFRDPGICLDKEIPGHVNPEQLSQYRFCDRCQVWQTPDGIHCPECNVCVAGYDHHCVWMGTCIGKRNYRQFVLFNMSWIYYIGYLFFWILTIGPLIMK